MEKEPEKFIHKVHEIKIPQLGVNDEFATLVEWLVQDKVEVHKGDPLCVIETSKATTELVAEESGYLRIKASAGEEVKIRSVIGFITDSLATELPRIIEKKPVPAVRPATVSASVRATLRAKAMANLYGFDLKKIDKKGIIREKDVIALVAKEKPGQTPLVAIYGAGPGGNTVKECLELGGVFKVAYFVDDSADKQGLFAGIPVIKGDQLETLKKNGVGSIFVAIANSELRLTLKDKLGKMGFTMINAIHPKAYVSPSVLLGVGNHIKAGAVIDTNTVVGDCCIIDDGAFIAHDNLIGSGCHIAPGVAMGSNIEIGEHTIVGIGASISTKLKIGKNVIIAVGSSVTNDIPDNVVIEGVPGKIIGERK